MLAALSVLAVMSTAEVPVGTFTSRPFVFETNSHWIEGPDGLILIDTQFLPDVGVLALEKAERATGKKVVLAIVLHPNPDKFNGAAALRARGVRVITSEQVAAEIPAVHTLRKKWFFEKYSPDYPADAPEIERFGNVTQTIEAGGLTLKLHVMGIGCSRAHVVVEVDGAVFVGDLVSNGVHAWIELGMLPEWMETLDAVAALKPARVFVGRGASGGPELIAAQRAYLLDVWERVRALKPSEDPSAEALATLKADIEAAYPAYGYAAFIRIGLPAVWSRARGR